MIGDLARKEIQEKSQELIDLSKEIWDNPEVAWTEENASKWTGDFLEKEGFEVEKNYTGIPTAIKASWGKGSPVIGLLGEYDALPGMSQTVGTEKEAIKEGGAGQACGHNLLGVAHVGAAIGIKKELEEKGLDGTIIFYGCPAEEVLIGKPFMARDGGFKELDMSIAWHPGTKNFAGIGSNTALNNAKFHFKGITAHAGGDPHNGRSALDAAELMSVGANYLREHVTDDVRIHYVYEEAGTAPNIVPDRATVWYYVRAMTRDGVEDTYERLKKVSEGAAMMTETEVSEEFLGGCYNTLQNHVLVNTLHDSMTEIGAPTWTEEELEFAETLNKVSANYDELVEKGAIKDGEHLADEISPIAEINSFGSTDVGDVQHMAPGVFFTTATFNSGAAGHSWQNTACSGHSVGTKGMLFASEVMATTGMKIFEDTSILEKAQEEFKNTMGNRKYVCPIPDDTPLPSKDK